MVSLARVFKTLGSGVFLKCPRCGGGKLFDGFFRMRQDCSRCHLRFEREQGFFVGAIYINYAATVMIVIPGFFLVDHYAGVSLSHQLLLWGAFAVFFPMVFFRHSRSFWLSLAYLFDPEDGADLRVVRK